MKTIAVLIWKELAEQAWKPALASMVLGISAYIGLHARIDADNEMLTWICLPAVGLLPLLVSTGLVAAEREAGTLQSLAALPVPLRTVLAVKTIVGLFSVVVPLAVAMGVSLAVAGGREMSSGQIVTLFARTALSAAALLVWMLAGTVRLPSESRAALVGLGLILFWTMAVVGFMELNTPLLSAVSPLSLIANAFPHVHWHPPSLVANTAVQSAVSMGLWFWAARAIGPEVSQ